MKWYMVNRMLFQFVEMIFFYGLRLFQVGLFKDVVELVGIIVVEVYLVNDGFVVIGVQLFLWFGKQNVYY